MPDTVDSISIEPTKAKVLRIAGRLRRNTATGDLEQEFHIERNGPEGYGYYVEWRPIPDYTPPDTAKTGEG